ncbi:MAG: hypothetical protein CMG06_07425 [Candidatus Marinimicrobia bacterium]|nr:hypothetical protein [Candidatus Neomarinimicrobiota bacterium]|tara:strand:+ start:2962 stop:4026 length:1065 start_codon:yes stop_codon:yes gene_type:complete
MKHLLTIIVILLLNRASAQCDSASTYFEEIPDNVTILVGDSCFKNNDINVLDSIIIKNELDYESALGLGTQTWFNGRLRFLVAGNYGNNTGVNDTIYYLPENMGDLDDLASLYLEWNRISELPESFHKMSNLFSLYINNNILTSVGDSLGNLSNLYFLDLGYNKITYIPSSICELENLSYLWLFNNELHSLPDCFCNMEVNWSGNDNGGYPYFAIGANNLCIDVPTCASESDNFELSLDQFYYSFPVYSPQDCDMSSIQSDEPTLPYQYLISTPYPNPFNPKVNIKLEIPHDRKMNILVYDGTGKSVDVISKGKIFQRGSHHVTWDGSQYSSGIYYIKFNDGSETQIQKTLLLK